MKTQKVKKENTKPTDCNNAILIRMELIKRGIVQRRVAEALGVTDGAITHFINGRRTSRRFNEWCLKTLGIQI